MTLLARADHPITFTACYSVTLYCDRDHSKTISQEFNATSYTTCMKLAHRVGWRVNRDSRTATCPACTKEMAKAARQFAAKRTQQQLSGRTS